MIVLALVRVRWLRFALVVGDIGVLFCKKIFHTHCALHTTHIESTLRTTLYTLYTRTHTHTHTHKQIDR